MRFALFMMSTYIGFAWLLAGCSAVNVQIPGVGNIKPGAGMVPVTNPVSVAGLTNQVNTLKATLAKAQADMDKSIGEAKAKYAAQRNETEPKLAAAEKNLAAAEIARTQWWMRFTAWALLFAGVVLLAISFWGKVPVFKGLLRAASGVLASLWLTLLLTAAVWPYMGWILAGLAVCGCVVGLVYAIRHHDELAEAFGIASRVADLAPGKEGAFEAMLSRANIWSRESLKALRDKTRAELPNLPPVPAILPIPCEVKKGRNEEDGCHRRQRYKHRYG